MALKLKEGVDPGYRQPLEAGGGKEKDSPLRPLERSHPAKTLILGQRRLFALLTSRTVGK